MAIENSVSNDFYLRSSIVPTFSSAAYPVWYLNIMAGSFFKCILSWLTDLVQLYFTQMVSSYIPVY